MYEYPDYLMHYGVLGMKWGVRRYQNKDGSYMQKGRRRYFNGSNRVRTSHKDKLIAKYKEKGYSNKAAELAAQKRIRNERIMIAAGAITLTAAVAYLATRDNFDRADRIIKEGAKLGRIENNDSGKLYDGFYAFNNKRDAVRYKGFYGNQVASTWAKTYLMDLTTTGNIKIPSRDNAKKALSELIKEDPTYVRNLNSMLKSNSGVGHRDRLARKALRDLSKGKVTDAVYDAVNTDLTFKGDIPNYQKTKYYEKLASKGYNAIRDIHDVKYSGYKSQDPLIVFDKSKVMVNKISQMSASELISNNYEAIGQNALEYTRDYTLKALMAGGATTTGLTAGVQSAKTVGEKNFLRAYKKAHPETKKTDYQILKMYK